MEHYEPEEFAPLSELTNIKKEFDKIEIWLLGETIDLMNSIFAYSSALCGLAIVIIDDKEQLAAVEESAENMIGRIDLVRKHIKEVMGMEDLDKHQETLINTKIDVSNSM
jgi:hypothetical protein